MTRFRKKGTEFCPTCGMNMMLRYELPNMGKPSRFYCPTFPYVCPMQTRVKIKKKQTLLKKEIEPIFSLEDMRATGAETEDAKAITYLSLESFPLLVEQIKLSSLRLWKGLFPADTIIQIRSADEPATTFYFCLNDKCGKMWRED